MTGHYVSLAIDLHTRRYSNVAATALLHLRSVERLRSHPGYEGARHWKHVPSHVHLHQLGLATVGRADPYSVRPVDLTAGGRIVADMLEGLRRGEIQPIRCRCCGCLSDGVADLCRACDRDSGCGG